MTGDKYPLKTNIAPEIRLPKSKPTTNFHGLYVGFREGDHLAEALQLDF